MGDHYGEAPVQDRLREVAGNIIDVETEQQKTNELLGQILEELRKLNKGWTSDRIAFQVIKKAGQ